MKLPTWSSLSDAQRKALLILRDGPAERLSPESLMWARPAAPEKRIRDATARSLELLLLAIIISAADFIPSGTRPERLAIAPLGQKLLPPVQVPGPLFAARASA